MTEPVERPGTPVRRRDATATRAAIIDSARRLFADQGYEATTVRDVATGAGFTQGLVTRYFGSKEQLFLEATTVDLGVEDLLAGPLETLGRRLAEAVLERWGQEGAHDPLLILLRAAGGRPEAAAQLRDFLERESTVPLAARLRRAGVPAHDARTRAAAMTLLITGAAMSHRVAGSADLTSATGLGWALQALVDQPIATSAT